jgi:hypothetical protein
METEPEYLGCQGWAWISETVHRRELCKNIPLKTLELYDRKMNECIHRISLNRSYTYLGIVEGVLHFPVAAIPKPNGEE